MLKEKTLGGHHEPEYFSKNGRLIRGGLARHSQNFLEHGVLRILSILFSDAAWAPQLLEGSRHMASTRRLGSASEVIELELLASCSCAVFCCGRRSISVPGEQCSKIVSMITSDLLTLPSFVVVLMNLPAARMHMIASRLPQLWESKRFSS